MSDPVSVVIDGFAHGGDGVGRLDGKAVFVPGALPGETVTVTLTENRDRYARGTLVDVLAPAANRAAPPCPYVPRCGGCDLQHLNADGHAQIKRRVVTEQLERIGKITAPHVTDTRIPTGLTGYRSQIRLHATKDGMLGFYAHHSHTVVPITHCLIANPGVKRALDVIGTAPGAKDVTIRSFDGVSAVVTLTPSHDNRDAYAKTVARLRDKNLPWLTVNDPKQQMTVTVGPHTFHAPPDAFFQSSVAAATVITDEVLHAAGALAGTHVADLYAGVGLFSVPLAHAQATVTAVEANRAATKAAATNVAGRDVTVVTDTVENFLHTNDTRFDVVVLDPPRSGAGTPVIEQIVPRKPERIVYVACDPAAFARDARTLTAHGYQLQRAVPIDAFPMTHHVEVVATFIPGR